MGNVYRIEVISPNANDVVVELSLSAAELDTITQLVARVNEESHSHGQPWMSITQL